MAAAGAPVVGSPAAVDSLLAAGLSAAGSPSAAAGTSGPASTLPHAAKIQQSFGSHDISGVSAHVGGAAADASSAMGASAYASGSDVAFTSQPDLHTAAHEAAHVVQQSAGVQLQGGVGKAGDRYEVHADAVADKVVAGESAEGILDEFSGDGGGGGIQHKPVQFENTGGGDTKGPPGNTRSVS